MASIVAIHLKSEIFTKILSPMDSIHERSIYFDSAMNVIWIFALTALGSAAGLVLLVGFMTNQRLPKPRPGRGGDDNWSQRDRGPE